MSLHCERLPKASTAQRSNICAIETNGSRQPMRESWCVSPRTRHGSSALLRRGSRIAGRLNTDWFAVYVQTPQEAAAPDRLGSSATLARHDSKRRELCAEVVRLQASDPVRAILDFAKSHAVGYIVIGRSNQPWWRRRRAGPPCTGWSRRRTGLICTLCRSMSGRCADEAAW